MRRKHVLTLMVAVSCCWVWLAVPSPAAGQVLCGQVIPHCTECMSSGPYIVCKECAPGYQPSPDHNKCVPCSLPNCKTCRGTTCTACQEGFELQNGTCVACTTIDPNCTSCSGGKCTGCASGYGASGGACVPCAQIQANCTQCSTGTCTACGNGYAANLQGQCVQPGTSGCSFDVQGQCCRCQYDCQAWNPPSGSCVGSSANGCGSCMSRQ